MSWSRANEIATKFETRKALVSGAQPRRIEFSFNSGHSNISNRTRLFTLFSRETRAFARARCPLAKTHSKGLIQETRDLPIRYINSNPFFPQTFLSFILNYGGRVMLCRFLNTAWISGADMFLHTNLPD